MATQSFFQVFLLLHLIGFILFIGTSITDFVTLNQFWKQYSQDKDKSLAVLQAMAKFPTLMGIGFGVIILSGVGMMAITHGVIGEQLWFRIKFGILIAIIITRIIGRRQGKNLKGLLAGTSNENTEEIKIVKRKLTLFHFAQLIMLFSIIILSVFKFN